VLDPSLGEGALLEAAAEGFAQLGCDDAHKRIWGAELSQASIELATRRLGRRVRARQLLAADFFSLTADTFGGTFDAILSNPPYIRHHRLKGELRDSARRSARRAGIDLPERADAWAYFVAHLLTFLSEDGRMGLLLPGSVLHAGYADPVLEAVEALGAFTRLIRVRELLFPGVQERTVVLLIDRGRRGAAVEYREVADLRGLRKLIDPAKRSHSPGRRRDAAPQERFRHLLSAGVQALWAELTAQPEVTRLGDVADVHIGVVTGANAFFLRTPAETRRLGGSNRRWPVVVTSSKWLERPLWTTREIDAVDERPSRLMVIEPGTHVGKRLRASIGAAEKAGLHQRSHCRNRTPWYALTEHESPDLFLPYMGAAAPRLIVNVAGSTCTNAIHRVTLRPGAPSSAALAAVSWTSLYRLSAELAGRHYGGGVLKLEIGEAAQLRIASIPGAAQVLREIGARLSAGGPRAAIAYADRAVLNDRLGLSTKDLRLLRTAAVGLERRRSPR
jgi:hypothetical protein